jgi:hypothetical protein
LLAKSLKTDGPSNGLADPSGHHFAAEGFRVPLVNAGQATTSAPGVAGPEVEACLARFALTLLFTPAATLKEAGHWGLLPRDCAAEANPYHNWRKMRQCRGRATTPGGQEGERIG